MSINEAIAKFTKNGLTVVQLVAELRANKVTRDQALQMLKDGKITIEAASEFLKEPEKLPGAGGLYCKVSEKGAISVYGLQRMPVTLYVEQWDRLLTAESGEEFRKMFAEFVKANEPRLKRKDRTAKAA